MEDKKIYRVRAERATHRDIKSGVLITVWSCNGCCYLDKIVDRCPRTVLGGLQCIGDDGSVIIFAKK